LLRLLLLLAFAAVVHAPSLGNGFALDDRYLAKAYYNPGEPNEMIETLQPLSEYFGSHYWRGVERANPLYRPVTILSYALVYHALGKPLGNEALPQHLCNVALFVASVWLVWVLLGRCGARGAAQALGTAVFAAHALHAEAVSAVSGRAELLAFCFGVGFVLLGHQGLAARGALRVLALLAGGAVSFFLAIASKENALAFLPFAVVCWITADHAAGGRGITAANALRSGLVAGALAHVPIVAFALLRAGALAKIEPGHRVPWVMNPLFAEPAGVRIPSALMIWGFGLVETLVPFRLAADWGASVFTPATGWLDPRVLAAAIALGGLLAVGLVRARHAPLLFAGACAFLGLSFLTTNIPIPIGTTFAERLYFSATLGLAFAVAELVRTCPARWRRAAGAAVIVWCAGSAGLAFGRAFDWKDDATLYRVDARTQPRSMFLRFNAAVVAGLAGDPATRERHLREAVAIEPRFARAWNELAVLELARQDLAAAEACILRGLASEQADPEKDLPMLRVNQALVHSAKGNPEKSLQELEAVLRSNAGHLRSRIGQLFLLLHGRVSSDRMLAFLRLGAELERSPEWSLLAGLELVEAGRHAEAEAVLRSALPAPADPAIRAHAGLALARALAGLHREAEAAEQCRRLAGAADVPEDVREQARRMLAVLPR